MKLGVISDIHGDFRALQRALRLLREKHFVERIWCAGDLVGRGSQPDEVVARLIADGIPTVMGNHDEMMLRGGYHHFHTRTLRTLSTLPRTHRAQVAGRTLVMVHGSPRSNTESVSLRPAERHHTVTWLEKIGADILITGHTHVPMAIRDYRGLVVNPGSLFNPMGFQRSSSETYGVLDVTAMQFAYYPLWD